MFTQTSPVSIGQSRPPSPGTTYSPAPGGSRTSVRAKTPASSARLANVLSTPNATSPVGSFWVSTSLLVSVPPSPAGWTTREYPDCSSNRLTSDLGSTNESCVTSSTSLLPPGSSLEPIS